MSTSTVSSAPSPMATRTAIRPCSAASRRALRAWSRRLVHVVSLAPATLAGALLVAHPPYAWPRGRRAFAMRVGPYLYRAESLVCFVLPFSRRSPRRARRRQAPTHSLQPCRTRRSEERRVGKEGRCWWPPADQRTEERTEGSWRRGRRG